MYKKFLLFAVFLGLVVFIPIAGFASSPSTVNVGDSIQFTDTSTDDKSIDSWNWSFGDGSTSNVQNPEYSYSYTGIYNITLEVVDSDGFKDTRVRTIEVQQTLNADDNFSINPDTPTVGETISFSENSSGDIVEYLWEFGDGDTSSLESPDHAYSDTGDYTVTLTVKDSDGDTDQASQTITVLNKLEAKFNYSPNKLLINELVSFDNKSTGSPDFYKWYFGNGDTTTTKNPSYSYSSYGSYDVKLVISDENDQDSVVKTVNVNALPVADFSYSPDYPVVNESIDFNGLSSDSDGTIQSWYWEFGNGDTSAKENPSYVYDNAGTYTVSLTVTDNDGDTDLYSSEIHVLETLTVDFSYQPTSPLVDNTIEFINTSDPEADTFLWEFGNGDSLTEENPSYTYESYGNYEVTLTGYSQHQQSSVSKFIDINTKPFADFSYNPDTPVLNEAITFSDLSSDSDGTIQSWYWEFGNGDTSSEANPVYSYNSTGTFPVTLTVVDSDNYKDSVTKDVVVLEKLIAGFKYKPSKPLIDQQVNFDDTSTGGPTSYSWSFSNGDVSTSQNPSTTYDDYGSYDVTLTVYDDNRTDSLTKSVRIYAQPIANFTYNPDTVTVGQSIDFMNLSSDSDGSINLTSWDFGDGSSSYNSNPVHKYSSYGLYTVKLTVVDNTGKKDSVSKQVMVNAKPNAKFSYNPDTAVVNESVDFTDLSTDPDGNIQSWYWEFGNSDTSTNQNPSVTFSSSGYQTVKLIVTDNDGYKNTYKKEIKINSEPDGIIANFDITSGIPKVQDPVQFSDRSSDTNGTIQSWYWEFGDGDTSIKENPAHSFPEVKEYTVSLTVTDNDGNQEQVQKNVNIQPVFDFTWNPKKPRPTFLITFSEIIEDTGSSFSNFDWTFESGPTLSGSSVDYKFPSKGIYDVTLTAINNFGDTRSLTKQLEVKARQRIDRPGGRPPNTGRNFGGRPNIASFR